MDDDHTEHDPDWAALAAAANHGDDAAAREIVQRLYPQIAGRISRLLPRREEIEDIAQEVFLRMFSRLGQYRGGSFRAWVDAIARRVCHDLLRKRRVRPEWRFADFTEDPPEASTPPADHEPEAAAILARLFSAILPEQAYLLEQVELEGHSIGEVSNTMGWTAVGGRLRLHRARNALKRAYNQLFPDTP